MTAMLHSYVVLGQSQLQMTWRTVLPSLHLDPLIVIHSGLCFEINFVSTVSTSVYSNNTCIDEKIDNKSMQTQRGAGTWRMRRDLKDRLTNGRSVKYAQGPPKDRQGSFDLRSALI